MMQSKAIPTADEQKYIWYHSCKHANVRRRFPDGSVDFGQSYAMNETTIHPSVSCQKITFYEADQMDKSLRCKIKSEWEEREEVKKKHRGKNVCKQDCNRCQISRRCEN